MECHPLQYVECKSKSDTRWSSICYSIQLTEWQTRKMIWSPAMPIFGSTTRPMFQKKTSRSRKRKQTRVNWEWGTIKGSNKLSYDWVDSFPTPVPSLIQSESNWIKKSNRLGRLFIPYTFLLATWYLLKKIKCIQRPLMVRSVTTLPRNPRRGDPSRLDGPFQSISSIQHTTLGEKCCKKNEEKEKEMLVFETTP